MTPTAQSCRSEVVDASDFQRRITPATPSGQSNWNQFPLPLRSRRGNANCGVGFRQPLLRRSSSAPNTSGILIPPYLPCSGDENGGKFLRKNQLEKRKEQRPKTGIAQMRRKKRGRRAWRQPGSWGRRQFGVWQHWQWAGGGRGSEPQGGARAESLLLGDGRDWPTCRLARLGAAAGVLSASASGHGHGQPAAEQ
jgi:hypothetical protein